MTHVAYLLVAVLALAGSAATAAPNGDTQPAKRVVSLNPSLTAMLIALDAQSVLVGVDSPGAVVAEGLAAVITDEELDSENVDLVLVRRVDSDLPVVVAGSAADRFRVQLLERLAAVRTAVDLAAQGAWAAVASALRFRSAVLKWRIKASSGCET